jgi:hypothetical protein
MLVLAFMVTESVFSQSDVSTSNLKGTVTDQNNDVIVGAVVTAREIERGITHTIRTSLDGSYQIPLLHPGNYELRIEATGFETKILKEIELTIGQITVYNVQLRVKSVTGQVLVKSDAPLVETERTQQANVIDNIQIENLPNLGRDFTSYVFTLPGVSSSEAPRIQNPGTAFPTTRFSIGGSNGRSNLITIDGGENEYGSGQLRTAISVEAIQEYQVNRNSFNAEFGFTAGSAVNIITKGGTNAFHGNGYIFYRSQRTSARNFFDLDLEKAFERRISPGASFGGPIIKNKLFYFTSYEEFKADAARFRRYIDNPGILGPATNSFSSINLREQARYLSQLETSPNANIRRIGATLRQALTTTNFPMTIKLLGDNSGTFNAPDRRHIWTTRIDYQISNTDSLTGRFSLYHTNTDNLPANSNITSPSASATINYKDYTTLGTWYHNFSSRFVNQLRGQISPHNSARTTPKAPESTSLLIQGIGNFGRDFATPFDTLQNRYQLEDTVFWSRGSHNFKFGTSYRSVNFKVVNELWFGGEWTFSSDIFPLILAVSPVDRAAFIAFNLSTKDPSTGVPYPANGPALASLTAIQSFNLGLPFQFRQGFNNPEWKDQATYLGTFAQDSWKFNKSLTLDYGIRVDFDAEPKPLKHHGYFSPRFGFALDPWGNQKTVIRGGGGLFYAPIFYQVPYIANLLNDSGNYINQIFKTPLDGVQSPAVIWSAGIATGRLPFKAISEANLNALGISTTRGAPGRVIFDVDSNYKNNYSVEASLGISHQLMRDMSIDIAYLLYKGVHIGLSHEVNYKETGLTDPLLGPILKPIDPTIAQKNIYQSIGNSIYHGTTASLTKRFNQNYQFQINYTFSKAIDDQTDLEPTFSAFIPTRLNLERAISIFDIRHNFVASGVFRSPFKSGAEQRFLSRVFADISISPIVFLRSGIPFTVRIGRDINGDTHGLYDRPFNASRNTSRGANFSSTDLRVSKRFYMSRDSELNIEFIAEATNLFNHTNFLSVNDVFGTSPEFLRGPFDLRGSKNIPATSPLGFNSAAPPRQVQFGLKISF